MHVWGQSKSLREFTTKTHGGFLDLEDGLKFCNSAQICCRGRVTLIQQVLEAFKSRGSVKVNHGEILEKCVILSSAEQQRGKSLFSIKIMTLRV